MSTMLAARLAIVEQLHAIELELTRESHARAAAALVRGKTHTLGNAVQIARLSALQLEQRVPAELKELVADLVTATEQATTVLGQLIAAANAEAPAAKAPIAPAVRAAAALIQPAAAAPVEVAIEIGDDVMARASADELEALALALLYDAVDGARVRLVVRPRTIAGKAHVQLLRCDDRRDGAVSPLVEALAIHAGGEASAAPGRDGLEIAVELPV
jgi:hypothetical protein